jgi:hypothetical protein
MTKADPEVGWPKLKFAKSCYVLITELGRHSVTRGINSQDVIPDETNIDFDISKHSTIFPSTLGIRSAQKVVFQDVSPSPVFRGATKTSENCGAQPGPQN